MAHIWFKEHLRLEDFSKLSENTMSAHLGIKFIELGNDYLVASMPVDYRTTQPLGILHGGASVALAETIGSVASFLVVDNGKFICVGLEVNANHVKAVKQGIVTGTASPVHIGRSTHIWQIHIRDEMQRLVCISRLTVAILDKDR